MRRPVLWLLGLYREYRGTRPDACRFDPTCSAYVLEAVQLHGVARGLFLGTRRVLRCHPFGGRGYDPVPGAEPTSPNRVSHVPVTSDAAIVAAAPSVEPAGAALASGFTTRKHSHA